MARVLPLLLLLLAPAGPLFAEGGKRPPTVPVAEALRPLRPWLANEDWSVRSLAALELRAHAEPGVVLLAAQLLDEEKHAYAAACALKALAGRPRHDLVREGGVVLARALVRLAQHEHPVVRERAFAVLQRVPPVRLGTELARYLGWWERGQEALRVEQRTLLARTPAPRGPSGDGGTVQTGRKDDDLYEHLERIRRHGLELCIVMDHTGSMSPVIGAAKARVLVLLDRIRAFVPRFRAGLVTYDDRAMLRIPLSMDGARIQKAFARVAAAGGGDMEEGVDKGIRMALTQELLGWSRSAQRVLVVVGDAPPHDPDVARMLRDIGRAREDDLFEHPVVVHTISANDIGVEHFAKIAKMGGGHHVRLRSAGSLVDSMVLLAFGGGAEPKRVRAWMDEIAALRKVDPALR